jgi:hypothetical protein
VRENLFLAGFPPELQPRVREGRTRWGSQSPQVALDKEEFAMRTLISPIIWPESIAVVNRRWQGARAGEDSPYSTYLRLWIAHRAAQHRSLLRNIDAAGRIGLAPVIVTR